jgi:biopolymer transport protein ExbD
MDFDNSNNDSHNEFLSEINMIPFIDVMLVLLILFIILAPLFTPQIITVNIPQVTGKARTYQPNSITLTIDKKGFLFWNGERVSHQAFIARLNQAAPKKPQPELHLYADKETLYQDLAQIMSAIQQTGIVRLSLVTRPDQ